MKTRDIPDKSTAKPRLSLEQKVKLLVRKARASERRRKRASQPPCRSEFCRMRTSMLPLVFLTSFTLSFGAEAMTSALTFTSETVLGGLVRRGSQPTWCSPAR